MEKKTEKKVIDPIKLYINKTGTCVFSSKGKVKPLEKIELTKSEAKLCRFDLVDV